MKTKLIAILAGLSLAGIALAADMETSTTTTTTTSGGGTVTAFSPGESIVVRTESATEPVSYKLSKKVTYVTKTGSVIEPATIKVGVPVTVHYVKEGPDMIVDRVVVDQSTTTTTTTP